MNDKDPGWPGQNPMRDQKFDIPDRLVSPSVPQLLGEESVIRFECHSGVACFNACCRQADVMLAPYDVLRLQGHLGMNSEAFLSAYTVPFNLDPDGVPGIKLRTDNAGACLFLDGDKGCAVYAERPTVCRYYPVAVLNMRDKDTCQPRQQYSLIKESHCKGHQEPRTIRLGDYRKEQGVDAYDAFNRSWYELILKKRSGGPGVGRPSEMSLQLFFMASFNFDMLRRFVLSDNFRQTYVLSDDTYAELAADDLALIAFGDRLMRQVLFGEKTIPERSGAWDKRVEDRKSVWEMQTRANIAARQARETDDDAPGCSDA